MAQNNDATTEEPTNDQIEHAKQIDTIVVDPDAVVEHTFKNINNKQTLYDARKFEVKGVGRDGPCKLSAGVDPRDDGGYYPDSPHPVWISPGSLIQGLAHDETDGLQISFPSRGTCRSLVRDDHPELGEDTDEFEALVDEYYEESCDVWRASARGHLKDELTFQMRAANAKTGETKVHTHTVDVKYE